MIKLGKGHKITLEKMVGWQAEINEYSNIHQEEVVLKVILKYQKVRRL